MNSDVIHDDGVDSIDNVLWIHSNLLVMQNDIKLVVIFHFSSLTKMGFWGPYDDENDGTADLVAKYERKWGTGPVNYDKLESFVNGLKVRDVLGVLVHFARKDLRDGKVRDMPETMCQFAVALINKELNNTLGIEEWIRPKFRREALEVELSWVS